MTTREQPARLIYSTSTPATRCEHPGCAYLAYADHCPHHQEQDHTP